MKRSFYFLLLIVGCSLKTFSQDVGFSQFYDQPYLRNPALSGNFEKDMRLSASYRNQWNSVTIPYRTMGLSAEVKIYTDKDLDYIDEDKRSHFTVGMQLLRDIAGSTNFSTIQIMPAVNYTLSMSKVRRSLLSAAIMPGVMQQRFDPSKLQMNDQFIAGSNGTFSIAPTSQQVFDNTQINYLDFSTGISYAGEIINGPDYFLGTAMFHIKRPHVGFFQNHVITLNRKLALNGGLSFPLNNNRRFIVYGDLFKQYGAGFQPAGTSTFQAGAMMRWSMGGDPEYPTLFFTLGALYRFEDAAVPVIQLEFPASNLMIGMSYDVNISKLSAASHLSGGPEIILTYRNFWGKERREQMHMQQWKCPRF